MKTRTNSTKTRFGRILSGVMTLAMSASLFAAVPASAETTTATSNPYELIYDISANYAGTDHFKKDGDVIYNPANDQNNANLETVIPNDAVEKIKGKKVRFHYEYMTEADTNPVFMVKTFGVYDSDKNAINGADVSIGFQGRLQSDKSIKIGHAGKIWDYSAPNPYITNADGSDFKFNKGQWYSMDTVFDYKTYDITYYIDGRKVGTSSFSNYSNLWNSIRKIQICLFKTKDNDNTELDFVAARQNWRNMKIDTGFGVDVTNTDDNGAVVSFTEPVTDLTSVTVKCLEKGTTQTVTATKVNDMQYTIAYDAKNSVGGDYALIFDDEFAAAHGMTSNTVVYAQTPSGYASNEVLYDAYDEFNEANIAGNADDNRKPFKKGNDNDIVNVYKDWGQSAYFMYFDDAIIAKMSGKKAKLHYEYKHGEVANVLNGIGGAKHEMREYWIKNGEGMLDTGFYRCGLSVIKENGTGVVKYSSNNNNGHTATADETLVVNNADFMYTANTWYTIDTIYDFKNHKVEYYMGEKAEGATEYSNYKKVAEADLPTDESMKSDYQYVKGMESLRAVQIYSGRYGNKDMNFKNMQLIDLSECNYGIKSVSYSADGTNFAPAIDKVDCETKFVKIEFTNPMDETTLNGITVSKNATDLTTASKTLSTDKKTYTIELTNTLEANGQYDVIVPDTVKTESSVKFNKAYEGTITTTAGTLAVKALKIKKGETEITADNKNTIAANDKVKAYAEIKNTTTRTAPAYVCVCVYNNGVLTGVNFDKVELKKEATTNGIATKEVEVEVKNTENLTIKAFVWENFSSMVPLSASYGI